ncbi:MAG TPA: LysR family transcriptional regulator [Chthoniobacterales bacterium]|jgi:LysR family transcriptional regulator for metE and metH|nr:LysR family transcriptional regulator [Chthoniobacterales bacterium]
MPADLLRYISFEMRHLRLVLAVAEERSLTRAAGRLRLTTSALSHQLRQLEELAGTSMFFRDGRSMRPTPAGETLAEAARNALTVVQNAEERLRRGAEQQPQVVRLCTHCFTGYSWLPAIISKFTERSRGRVEVHISVESTRQPFDALRERTVDLALTLNRPTEPDFAVRSLAEDEMVLLVARTHRLAKQSWVTVSEFAHEHLILHPADIQESQFFREHLAPHGVRPKRFTGIMLTEAIIEMVKAGLGVTVLPRWTAANFLSDRGLVALRVTRGGIFRNWYAVTLKRPDNPQLIADLIAEVAGAIGEKKDAPVPGKRRLASGRRRQKVGRRSRGQAGKKI